jgi:hypothetical protein
MRWVVMRSTVAQALDQDHVGIVFSDLASAKAFFVERIG